MANSFQMPLNIALTAGVAAKLTTDTTVNAEEYILQASSLTPGLTVIIGRLQDDGTIPAAPYDDTNAYTMYTLDSGSSVPLRKALRGRINGESVKLSDLWGFCASNIRLFANPLKRL
jgi:hypothetical protein